jgi:protein-disulfide isomerase
MDRLFKKYEVKVLLKGPEVIAHTISVDGEPSVGPAAAPVTIVMFSDFQCPACSRTHPVLKRVMAEYPGKVRLVVRDYPLDKTHPNAFNAALAANAAAKQGKYVEYIERLYTNQESLDKPSLLRFASELGLNGKQFEIDFSDAAAAAEIKQDQTDGDAAGVNSTPTIFVNGVKVHSLSASAFRRAINRALTK